MMRDVTDRDFDQVVKQAGVPVLVEFQQDLGDTLKVALRWDNSPETVALTTGHHQKFELAPGPHVLHLLSGLPPVSETHGSVPLVVVAGQPLRLRIDGAAQLTGTQLRVLAWNRERLIIDQTVGPGPSQRTWR